MQARHDAVSGAIGKAGKAHLEVMLMDRAAWTHNPATITVQFLSGDEIQFSHYHHLVGVPAIKRQVQKQRGYPVEEQQVFLISIGDMTMKPDRSTTPSLPDEEKEDRSATPSLPDSEGTPPEDHVGVIRLSPGQEVVFQCTILVPGKVEEPYVLQVLNQYEDGCQFERNSFTDALALTETLKDMAELAVMMPWCNWDKAAMVMKKSSTSTPPWEIQSHLWDATDTTKPFQVDLLYDTPESKHRTTIWLEFATFQESQTALVLMIHILETNDADAMARIRQCLAKHLVGKKRRAKRKQRAKAAARAAVTVTRDSKADAPAPSAVADPAPSCARDPKADALCATAAPAPSCARDSKADAPALSATAAPASSCARDSKADASCAVAAPAPSCARDSKVDAPALSAVAAPAPSCARLSAASTAASTATQAPLRRQDFETDRPSDVISANQQDDDPPNNPKLTEKHDASESEGQTVFVRGVDFHDFGELLYHNTRFHKALAKARGVPWHPSYETWGKREQIEGFYDRF